MRIEKDGRFIEISELFNDKKSFVLSISEGSTNGTEGTIWKLRSNVTKELLKVIQRALQLENDNEIQTAKEGSQS